jgi:hypothetical protein
MEFWHHTTKLPQVNWQLQSNREKKLCENGFNPPKITSDHQFYPRVSVYDPRIHQQAKFPRRLPPATLWYIMAATCGFYPGFQANFTGYQDKRTEYHKSCQDCPSGNPINLQRIAVVWYRYGSNALFSRSTKLRLVRVELGLGIGSGCWYLGRL